MSSLPPFEVQPHYWKSVLLLWLGILAVLVLAGWIALRVLFGPAIQEIPWDTRAWQQFEEPTDRLAMREGLDGVLMKGLPVYSVRDFLGTPDREWIVEGDDSTAIVLRARWRMGEGWLGDSHSLFADFHGRRGYEKLASWRVGRDSGSD